MTRLDSFPTIIHKLDSRYASDDTCPTGSGDINRRVNEEADGKESLRKKDYESALHETRGCKSS
jgi:hypothetical protein